MYREFGVKWIVKIYLNNPYMIFLTLLYSEKLGNTGFGISFQEIVKQILNCL